MENDPLAMLAPPDPTWNPGNTVPPDAMVAAPAAPAAAPAAAEPMATIDPSYPTSIPSETAPNNPDIERSYHESTWRNILDKVGGILGGDTTIHVTKDKDGNVTMTHDPSTTGEKWSRIAAAALGGAAQGAANSRGPGGAFKGAAAGTEYGLQVNKERQEDADKQVLHQAQMVKLNQDNVINAWNYKNLPQKYADEQAERALNHAKTLDEMGATPIAMNVSDPKDLAQRGIADPKSMKAHMEGNVFVEPNGKGGANFWNIPGTAGNQRTTSTTPWFSLSLDPDDKTKTVKTEHIAPAGEKYSDYFKRTMGQQAANDKITSEAFRNEQAKARTDREKTPTTQDGAIIAKWNKLLPNDPVKALDEATKEIQKSKERLKETGGAEPTWVIGEDKDGKTVFYNSKNPTQMVNAPDNINKLGTKAKQDAAVEKATKPARDAMEYADLYMGQGAQNPKAFTGSGDEALMDKYFELAKPSSGFRMSGPQQSMLINARSWMGSLKGRAYHELHGTWFAPEQRQEIVNTMGNLATARGITPGEGGVKPQEPTIPAGRFRVKDKSGATIGHSADAAGNDYQPITQGGK
jgi:hypothetical protein